MPSAVKHNAMRFYHSHVWGYRWPAVCLCSSPLGQLEPSISSPWAPLCPSGRVWPPTTTTSWDCLIWSVAPSGDTSSHTQKLFSNWTLYVAYFQAFRTSFLNLRWRSHAAKHLKKKKKSLFIDGFVILLRTQSSPWEQFYDASDGHKLICCWSHSTQHVQSQAFLPLQMESIEAHYCVLGGVSSTMNSLAHF